MTLIWIAVAAICTLLLADYVYRQIASYRIRRVIENVPLFGVVDEVQTAADETFRIPVNDGEHLAACLHVAAGTPRGVIIFCPELNGTRWSTLNYCAALRDAGFTLIGFDFRNQGDSDRHPNYSPIHWVTDLEMADVDAVISYVLSRDEWRSLPLGIFGVSRGGCAALMAACRHSSIAAVATDSAYSTRSLINHFIQKFCCHIVPEWFFRCLPAWHIKIVVSQAIKRSERGRGRVYAHLEREVHQMTQSVLLVSGSRDSYVAPAVTNHVAKMLGRNAETWIAPKAKHNKSRMMATEEYDQRLVDHFQRALATSAETTTPKPQKSRVA